MKKLIMIAAIFMMTYAGAFAQRGQQKEMQSPEQRAEKMTAKMTEELGLSVDQKQKIYQINLENAQKRQEQREAMQVEREAKRAEMQAQAKAQNDQIEAILTSEQKTKWEEVKKENRQEIHEGSKGRKGQGKGRGNSGSSGGSQTK
jgi:Spy/CpxP family protein refolding chaperone